MKTTLPDTVSTLLKSEPETVVQTVAGSNNQHDESTTMPEAPLPVVAPLGAVKPESLTGQMVEGAEILYDHSTETTRWIVWRHPQTKKTSLLIAQGKDAVSVNITNVVYFVAKILPTLGITFRLEKEAR